MLTLWMTDVFISPFFSLWIFFSPTHTQSSDSAAVTQLFLFLREAAARCRKHRSDVAFRDLLHPPADASQRNQKQHPLKSGLYNVYVRRLHVRQKIRLCWAFDSLQGCCIDSSFWRASRSHRQGRRSVMESKGLIENTLDWNMESQEYKDVQITKKNFKNICLCSSWWRKSSNRLSGIFQRSSCNTI